MISKQKKGDTNAVTIQSGFIKDGSDNRERFKEKTSADQNADIEIIIIEDEKIYNRSLIYDGDYFYYYNEEDGRTYKRKYLLDSREATSQVRACSHLATAARVTYPAALQRILLDAPLLAAGMLT